MASERITIRVPQELGDKLRRRSAMTGRSESELVREALETQLRDTGGNRSAYELAQQSGIVGCVEGTPKDLSTSRRHMAGFGKSK